MNAEAPKPPRLFISYSHQDKEYLEELTAHLSRCDNGPECVSRAIIKWLHSSNIETAAIAAGKPWQNGSHERFNDKFRDECLNLEGCRSRQEAKILIEAWRRHGDEVRPPSILRKPNSEGVHQPIKAHA